MRAGPRIRAIRRPDGVPGDHHPAVAVADQRHVVIQNPQHVVDMRVEIGGGDRPGVAGRPQPVTVTA